ncbi:MAG: nitroreductase [Spongiibacter sp.]|uniref:nitroreductase family protein n=2 Tax=Spongiibacter TaxID=630749 RepID=UPI000C0A3E30|nr:nitroreductase family protein [Spongiibacter sp.]MAK43557.1 nitroreductase [Spongiibacter sp.]
MGIRRELRKLFFRKSGSKSGISGAVAFDGEMDAVAAGKSAFYRSVSTPGFNSPLLRRNIHRLEKGLCFPSGKELFAEKYIEETVSAYHCATENHLHDTGELEWARSVLKRYFATVSIQNERVVSAYQRYLDIENESDGGSLALTPFEFGSIPKVKESWGEEFISLCESRVSCRWFEEKKVPRSKVEYAVNCATQAASACNRQPFQFLLIENPELKSKIVSLPFGTAGFGTDLPHLMMVVGDLSNFPLERDRHLIYIDSALATSQLLLGFTAQGLASVPINWPDVEVNHRSARELLGLENYHVPIMLVGFGIPLEQAKIPYSEKKGVEALLKTYD